jgi:Methionine gamma-lyase
MWDARCPRACWGTWFRSSNIPISVTLSDTCLPCAAETRVALVQRSCGYADRPTMALREVREVVRVVRAASPRCLVLVDNCYGEFTERGEPCSVRAQHQRVVAEAPEGKLLLGACMSFWSPGVAFIPPSVVSHSGPSDSLAARRLAEIPGVGGHSVHSVLALRHPDAMASSCRWVPTCAWAA